MKNIIVLLSATGGILLMYGNEHGRIWGIIGFVLVFAASAMIRNVR